MSEWLKNPPTEPGWYWGRFTEPGVYHVYDFVGGSGLLVHFNGGWNSLELFAKEGGEWFSERIEPPHE